MRVLHVIPSVSPRRGGPSTVIFPMLAALRARGIAAEIATSDEDAGGPVRRFSEPPEHESVPVRFFPRWRAPLRPLQDYTYCPAFVPWLEKNIAAYDLLHVHALFSHVPGAAMRLARRHGVPYVSRPLGQLGHWPLRQSAWRKKLYLGLFEKQNLRGAAALHFTSARERDEAAAGGFFQQAAVIPHGLHMPAPIPDARARLRARLGLDSGRQLVLFLGRLHRKKGLDRLVHALASLPEPTPFLLIAGEGPHQAEIERLAAQLRVDHRLRWLGPVAGEWKQVCLEGTGVFALTSHHENFGVAVLEALAAGASVLVSDQVALGAEIARHRLGVVVPLEPGAVAAGLARALTEVAPEESARRRAFVLEHYSWPANAMALEQLYRQMLRSHSPKRVRPPKHSLPHA